MNFFKKILTRSEIETGADNPVLRRQAKEVTEITPAVLALIARMEKIVLENLYSMPNFTNVGLAAPQVGKSLRIIVFRNSFKDDAKKEVTALINPKIEHFSRNKTTMEESCNSLPHLVVRVKRPSRIVVSGINKKNEKIRIAAKGFLARLIQHEVDHLNGVLIIDRVEKK